MQTVKAGNWVINGVFDRNEIETSIAIPQPNLAAISDRKVRRKIEHAVRASSLGPLFETVVKRTMRMLHSEKGDLELALDEGVVRAGGEEDKLCEAELELKAGSPTALLETAASLFASGPLRLAHASKAERGYNLVLEGKTKASCHSARCAQP